MSNNNFTPIHESAKDNDVNEVTRLLKQGEDIEAIDDYERTPLHVSAIHGSTEVAD